MQENILFTDHRDITQRLSQYISQKNIQEADIMEWCQQAENEYILDMTALWKYINVPLVVNNGIVLLPCNVQRIIDVFTSPNNSASRIEYANNRGYIFLGEDTSLTTIYINYIGTPITEDGIPLIAKGHEAACELYCMTKIYFEDSLYGKINPQIYEQWSQRFNNSVIAIKQSAKRVDRAKLQTYDAMKYSVMRIGRLQLASTDNHI